MNCAVFRARKKMVADVTIHISELTYAPYFNGVLFTKLRILQSRGTSQYSCNEHNFRCKLQLNGASDVLEPKYLKVSVRKESDSGKSYSKLGYVLINLACFASPPALTHQRKYILEGYSVTGRQDNSLLALSIRVEILSPNFSFSTPAEDKSKCLHCITNQCNSVSSQGHARRPTLNAAENLNNISSELASTSSNSATTHTDKLESPDLDQLADTLSDQPSPNDLFDSVSACVPASTRSFSSNWPGASKSKACSDENLFK
ncbi:hypothetical protein Ciccas_011880 [Cichlidogyrus casuarinus]|uniref:C2 NT-type domain-containing protein n=1 Tax=Cichlidogyrus casuarinus TaxID=1844966 RepID=A0ABD2PPZ3_9PLAT